MIKQIYHFYIPAMVNRVERWLSSMSQDGWVLTQQKGFRFTFEEQKPAYREYFMYSGFDLSKGFSEPFFWAEKTYRNRKSRLKHDPELFEVDLSRKDAMLDSIRRARNRFYRNHYIKLLVLVVVLMVPVLVFSVRQIELLWLLLPALIFSLFLVLYSLVSIVIILQN